MMKRSTTIGLVAAGALIAWRACTRPGPCGNPRVPQPAKPVDLARYTGKWFEQARYPNRFERHYERVTAEYAQRADGLVSVINSGHDARGHRRVSRGVARIVRRSGNAKLRVSFFGPFFLGRYWILDHDDDYQWAIVGEPSGRFLWILHRDAVLADADHEQLRRRVVALGYDLSLLRRTQQA